MKKSKIIISILIVLLIVLFIGFIKVKSERDWLQKNIDQTFASSYHELTLNLINETVDNISEAAIHKYKTENTKHSYNLLHLFQYSSYSKHNNADLNYIIGVLSQSSGYGAITTLNMDEELYHSIKNVPNDGFNNAEILREAKEALEKALVD
ncbi:MAG: hypothetical protein J6A61_05345 [Clostridia bacterium]|nr:hypothetical protein [Clostridia bacterium]